MLLFWCCSMPLRVLPCWSLVCFDLLQPGVDLGQTHTLHPICPVSSKQKAKPCVTSLLNGTLQNQILMLAFVNWAVLPNGQL